MLNRCLETRKPVKSEIIQKKKKQIIWWINVYSDVKLLEPAVDYALGRHVNLVQSRNESRSVETTLIPLRTTLDQVLTTLQIKLLPRKSQDCSF